MKNIPNAMKFSTQSSSSLLIINMMFRIADLGPKLKASDPKDLDSKLNASDVAIWQSEQIEHVNYQYINCN